MNNKIAIGCLIQWYEIELVEEYLQSVKNAVDMIDNKKDVIIDLYFNTDETLEKLDEDKISMSSIRDKFNKILFDIFDYEDNDEVGILGGNYDVRLSNGGSSNKLYTIADYRRDFNNNFCDEAEVLMWGETDSLIPRQTFQILDTMHTGVKDKTPKYVSFFATCKMWDDSWKPLEHNDFTNAPFYELDDPKATTEQSSIRYNMSIDERKEMLNLCIDIHNNSDIAPVFILDNIKGHNFSIATGKLSLKHNEEFGWFVHYKQLNKLLKDKKSRLSLEKSYFLLDRGV